MRSEKGRLSARACTLIAVSWCFGVLGSGSTSTIVFVYSGRGSFHVISRSQVMTVKFGTVGNGVRVVVEGLLRDDRNLVDLGCLVLQTFRALSHLPFLSAKKRSHKLEP